MVDESGSVSRRKLLLAGLLSSIAATAGMIFYPVVRFLWPRKSAVVSGALEVVAPYRVNELRPDADGKWPSPFEFGGKPCLLIKTADGEVRAFNATCTHIDCTVDFRPEGAGEIFCACHDGVYDLNGRNVSGPPPRPLETYKVTLRGEEGQEEIIVSHS